MKTEGKSGVMGKMEKKAMQAHKVLLTAHLLGRRKKMMYKHLQQGQT